MASEPENTMRVRTISPKASLLATGIMFGIGLAILLTWVIAL